MPHLAPAACLVASLSALLSMACGGAPPPYRTPDHWQKTGYLWPSELEPEDETTPGVMPSEASPPTTASLGPHPSSPSPRPSRVLPTAATDLSGRKCLARLRQLKVNFTVLRSLKGVENPVEITGPLGGIRFYAVDGRKLQMDCRLAVTLQELGPVFRQAGVTRIRYSGAYSYRTTRTGRLSHHAHGLAIDLHDFEFGSRTLTVKRDFKTGMGCRRRSPALNGLSCELRSAGVFQELLTPDYNSDHRDHLHVAVPRRDQMSR